jgi:hypothetical protein
MPCFELGVLVITEWCTATVPTCAYGHLGIGAEFMRFWFLLTVVQCFHFVLLSLLLSSILMLS